MSFGMQCSLILNVLRNTLVFLKCIPADFPQQLYYRQFMLFYVCRVFCVFVPVYVHSNLFLIQVMSQARHSIVKRCFHLLASNMAVIQSNYNTEK